jgi:hypothetical protein
MPAAQPVMLSVRTVRTVVEEEIQMYGRTIGCLPVGPEETVPWRPTPQNGGLPRMPSPGTPPPGRQAAGSGYDDARAATLRELQVGQRARRKCAGRLLDRLCGPAGSTSATTPRCPPGCWRRYPRLCTSAPTTEAAGLDDTIRLQARELAHPQITTAAVLDRSRPRPPRRCAARGRAGHLPSNPVTAIPRRGWRSPAS